MRILAIGDFHGKFLITRKFLKKNKVDFIVSSGDLPTADKLRDIIRKHWRNLKTGKIKFYEILGLEKTRKLVLEDDLSQHRIFKKLDSLQIPVFLIIGNGDYGEAIENTEYAPLKLPYKIEAECKNSKNVYHVNLKIKKFRGISIIGLDSTVFFSFKRDIKKAKKKLIKLFKQAKQPVIFLVHEPPFNTKLDKKRVKNSLRYGQHVGDKLVREVIERFQPILCICGHIHENQGKVKIGKTLVVNTGYGRKGESVLIDIEDNKVKFLKLN